METDVQDLEVFILAVKQGLVVLGTAWSIIIGLFIYIYNRNQKENEKRHQEHTKILEKLTDNQGQLQVLVAEIKTRQEVELAKRR